MAPIDLAVAIPTLIGSLLSFLATSIALIVHAIAPPGRHFRHALILNLLIADGINSLNNSISGIITMLRVDRPSPLSPGLGCNINAFVGQFSVQAVDFNVLIMSITVLLTVRAKRLSMEPSRLTAISLCALAWVPSAITSSIGLGLDAYGPVSGNWCWIKPTLTPLRYGLTHSWRMAIFLATFAIYTYIYIHLKRTFNRFALSTTSNTTWNTPADIPKGGSANDRPDVTDTSDIIVKRTFDIENSDNASASTRPGIFTSATSGRDIPMQDLEPGRSTNGAGRAQTSKVDSDRHVHGGRRLSKSNLRRMLLLNGYPVLYIVLWIPGIATRLVEAVRGSSPQWLVVLQSSTQYIGLANAVTYSWNEKMTQRVKRLVGGG